MQGEQAKEERLKLQLHLLSEIYFHHRKLGLHPRAEEATRSKAIYGHERNQGRQELQSGNQGENRFHLE